MPTRPPAPGVANEQGTVIGWSTVMKERGSDAFLFPFKPLARIRAQGLQAQGQMLMSWSTEANSRTLEAKGLSCTIGASIHE
jgi:hypothetical protein